MADYIKINPNAKNGDLMISKNIVEEISLDAINKYVKNVSLDKDKPIKVSFLKNGKLKVVVSLVSNQINEVKEAVSNALMAYIETLPFEVEVKQVEASK